ncbi:hypothetical protein GLP25_17975 [Photobacterium phosphoreum]|uniref:EpsG family protein n=1 Tax=Photobacterium phosphoreum TaxID=659 RepID=UPI001E383B7D|nr:EpsG family protein [Photobacterium phosphoreum]MCD9485055.1 hypothetical protein [Photobacterium phosphoreum]
MIKKNILLIIFLILPLLAIFYFPVIFSFYLFLMMLILLNKYNNNMLYLLGFFFAFGLATISAGLDSVKGDFNLYYSYYNYITIPDDKYFRFVFLSTLKYFHLSPRLYSFLCIFLIYFLFVIYSIKWADCFKRSVRDRYSVFILFLLTISIIPISLLTSYENALAFVFLFVALYYNSIGNRIVSLLILALSISVHMSVVVFIPFILFRWHKKNNNTLFLYSFLVVIVLCLISFGMVSLLPSSVAQLYDRFIYYTTGPWAKYVNLYEFYFLVCNFILVIIYSRLYFIYKKTANVYVLKIFIFMLPLLFFFLCFRTLSLRYITVGMLIYSPLMLFYLLDKAKSIYKRVMIIFLILFFSIPFNMNMKNIYSSYWRNPNADSNIISILSSQPIIVINNIDVNDRLLKL